jgi:hypothetical protein
MDLAIQMSRASLALRTRYFYPFRICPDELGMSSKRRSYDTDEITLRKVFAKSVVDNTNIGAMKVLTADGAGGTYWTIPSTNGAWNPSFNRIVTTAATFTADLSYNTFTLSEGTGIGFTEGAGDNQLYIYGKSFNQVDVSGNNSIYAFENNSLDPVLRFVGTGGLNIRSDPTTNTLSFDVQGNQISTSQFSFQKAKVLNTSTITGGISSLTDYIILNANDASSILTFVGIGDIELSTNYTTNSIFIGLDITTGSVSSLIGRFDTLSTNYTQLTDFSTATSRLSTISSSNFSSAVSTSYGINSNLSIIVFNLPFNQYTTLQQFNFTRTTLESGLSTLSTTYTPLPALFSTSLGINNRISTFNIISTMSTVNVYGGNVTDFTASVVNFYMGDLSTFSTTTGNTFLSTFSSIAVLTDQFNTLSTLTLYGLSSLSTAIGVVANVVIPSTVTGLETAGYLRLPSLVSTVTGLGTAGYLSSVSLYSTVAGLGTAGYVSTSGLVSTVEGLGTAGYISSPSLVSTVAGLGTIGYISSTQLISTVAGLDKVAVTKLIAGSNITLSPANGLGNVTINATGGGGGSDILALSTNFTSSIFYQGFNGTITPEVDFVDTRTFYFSTADVYLNTFSTYIRSTSRILVDFNYNFVFSYWRYYPFLTDLNTNGNVISFSTLLSYDSRPDTENPILDSFTTGTAIDAAADSNIIPYSSNSITRRQQFQVSTVGVMSAYQSPLQLYHRFDTCLYSNTGFGSFYSGLNSAETKVLYSSTNSVFVTIQN